MKRLSMLLAYTVLFVFFSLTVGSRQTLASFQVSELIGIVEQKNRSALPPPVQHEELNNFDRSDRATSIVVNGIRMFITRDTTVKNIEGQSTNFDEMAVPCQARVLYQELPNGGRNVLEIVIQKLLSGASNKWPDPTPQ